MIKNPKLGQSAWFIEDFTMRPREVLITCIKDQGVYVDEERFFRLWNLYRSKKQAVNAKLKDLVNEVSKIWDQHNKLSNHLDD